MSTLRPIHTIGFVVTTCSIQLISHRVNKNRSNLGQLSQGNEFSLDVGPAGCYYKLHRVNWPSHICNTAGSVQYTAAPYHYM